ncbi:hypothetical protein HS088_TW20G00398 [Tripterygium wilfordii]|uniref:Uncharacterized protein n=1 Tax=Tripterygium wilfordii TaxID=458696 RepID=A0A7J7C7B3_TRIWF|nr:uncharacterized protein LOC119987389 isoform X1 [Tripterygium wilfordii]KAF5730028.1 hypothetical protein HS088_TW20G00398 [Tripterygium wilfordii]
MKGESKSMRKRGRCLAWFSVLEKEGVYGLKTDIQDITEPIDDLSLNTLLDGSCTYPRLGKDKGKKAAIHTDNIMHSIGRACSILQLSGSHQSQDFAEVDSFSNKKNSPFLSSSVTNGANVDSCMADVSLTDKVEDRCNLAEASIKLLDIPLCKPKDVLKRLVLPPPKDLESLLLDATKPAVSSRNTPDMRSRKQMSRRASLPPFPWSHTFNGHCRINSDAAKLLTSKSTCQGRWVRIQNSANSLKTGTSCLAKLDSLVYDETLVPSEEQRLGVKENSMSRSVSLRLSWAKMGSSSPATCSRSSCASRDSGGELKYQANVEHCPAVLAAAETLYEMAANTLRRNQEGIVRWIKKPSQKVVKGCKSKLSEKAEEIFSARIAVMKSDDLASSKNGAVQMMPSKRTKLVHSAVENKSEIGSTKYARKRPANWLTLRSNRSSPNKSVRHLIAETSHPGAVIVKQ